MINSPTNEDPGFETDVNEIPADKDNGADDRLEDEHATDMEQAQEDAAEERKEGGYQ